MDDQKFFDEARTMFMSEGWSNFTKELELWLENITFDSCNTSDEFWASKGAVNALRRVLAYEMMVKQAELEADDESNS
jgi:hypothetical protein